MRFGFFLDLTLNTFSAGKPLLWWPVLQASRYLPTNGNENRAGPSTGLAAEKVGTADPSRPEGRSG